MKVLIVEEALRGLHGHWFQYINDIVKGGQEAGYEIDVAVHKDACAEILGSMPCRPIFQSTVFEPSGKQGGKLRGLARVLKHNRSFYKDLSSFLTCGNSYDLLIATTPTLDHLLAYWYLYWRFRNRGFGKLVLIFIHIVGHYNSDGSRLRFSATSLPLRCGLWSLRPLLKSGQLFLVTESEGLARQYQSFCGIKCPLVPHVTALPQLRSSRANGTDGQQEMDERSLVFGSFGFTRYDKGTDILQSAIRLLLQRQERVNARFLVQWIADYRLPDGTWVRKDPVLMNHSCIKYLPSFTSSNQYYEWLARTDVMVLPYRKGFYRDKLSRVAIDGVLAGMPFIYPVGTWMETLAKTYGTGVPFSPEDPVSLANAICEIIPKYASLKKTADSVQSAAGEDFSARAFFNIISKL